MDITKKLSLDNIFLFLFLVLFPFGQIFRIGVLQPIDLIVGLAALYSIVKRQQIPEAFKYLQIFLFIATVSWIFSIFTFHQFTILYGALYLVRLIAYVYFGVYIYHFVKKTKYNKELLLNSLLLLSVICAVFGWIQFFAFPSLFPFFVWGWDQHLYRLVGTFLDPGFLGLILVFGLILALLKKSYLLLSFLLVSLAFTYSRASYAAFAAAVLAIIYLNKKFKKLIFLIIGLGILALLLPTARNHSNELFRTFSITRRFQNYQSTSQIVTKSPVFGIGYDNMCIAYQKYVGEQSFASHACSGSDSSLLFILATTGIIGFMVFIYVVFRIAKSLKHSSYYIILFASSIALFIHSFFSNSVFYPWVMGWTMVLLALVI